MTEFGVFRFENSSYVLVEIAHEVMLEGLKKITEAAFDEADDSKAKPAIQVT